MESKLCVCSTEMPLEAFEQLCDICEEDSLKKSIGYCQQCNQYLCKLCCDHHGRIVATKHHKVNGKGETLIFGRDTIFGRKLIPSSVIVVPSLPSTESSSIPQIKYVNFFRDIDKMIVLCWYPSNKFYAISEIKEDKLERYSIGIINNNAICLGMEDDQIIVITPDTNMVCEIDISQPLFSKKDIFKTSGECRAIVEFDNGFAAAIRITTHNSVPEWQIQYLDRDGKIKHRISYDTDGNALFLRPKALATNHTQSTLFVLDDGKRNLLGINIAGEILFTFTHSEMEAPRSLVVDREGNIYVACRNKTLQVNKDGTKHVVAIKNNDSRETAFVAFNTAKELLVVGNGTDKLQYFSFV